MRATLGEGRFQLKETELGLRATDDAMVARWYLALVVVPPTQLILQRGVSRRLPSARICYIAALSMRDPVHRFVAFLSGPGTLWTSRKQLNHVKPATLNN